MEWLAGDSEFSRPTINPVADDPIIRATLDIALLTALSDGNVAEVERTRMAEIVQLLFEGRMPLDAASLAVDRCLRTFAHGEHERVLYAALESLPDPVMRRRAFRFAAAVALVDGWLDRGEIRWMNRLASLLSIDPADATLLMNETRRIVRVSFPPGSKLTE